MDRWVTVPASYHRGAYAVETIGGKWHLRRKHGNGASHTVQTFATPGEAMAMADALITMNVPVEGTVRPESLPDLCGND